MTNQNIKGKLVQQHLAPNGVSKQRQGLRQIPAETDGNSW